MTGNEVPTGGGHVATPVSTPPLDAVSGGAKETVEVVEVEDEKDDPKNKIPPEHLFHAEAEMTRKDQMKEKLAIQNQRKRKLKEQPEDVEEEPTSKEKAEAKKQKTKEQAAAKAEAKKQKTKEKAEKKAAAKKQKTKEKAEKKKKIAMAKKEKKEAEKKEKKRKEQEKKAAAKAKAKSKGRKRNGADDVQETPDPVQQVEEEQVPPVDPVPPSQPRPDEIQPEEPNKTQTGKKTFAGRNRPSRDGPAARFDACKGVFNSSIKDKLNYPSVLEARFPFNPFKGKTWNVGKYVCLWFVPVNPAFTVILSLGPTSFLSFAGGVVELLRVQAKGEQRYPGLGCILWWPCCFLLGARESQELLV